MVQHTNEHSNRVYNSYNLDAFYMLLSGCDVECMCSGLFNYITWIIKIEIGSFQVLK